jgi:hypothetical protein
VFKRFKRRQQFLVHVIQTLLQTVYDVRRSASQYSNLPAEPNIDVMAPDITERDNSNLAISVQRIVTAFAPLYNAKLIDTKEFVRLVYRFVAETMPDTVGAFAPVNVRGGGPSKLPPKDPNEIPDPNEDVPIQ